MIKTILLTGGLGYIGSHTAVSLIEAGYKIIIVDNLINSKKITLNRLQELTNKTIPYYCHNVAHLDSLIKIFQENAIDAVIHFAGLKSVADSVKEPINYYDNNLNSAINLIKAMNQFNCHHLVFSSSATVYGQNAISPINEQAPLSPVSPYGYSKLMIEQMLHDLTIADTNFHIVVLRYFNPIGAHPSGLIGDNPNNTPNNLMPYITQVAKKKLPFLSIYGNDYDTIDGTGVRDYVHVMDIANGHTKSLAYLNKQSRNIDYINLGTGCGHSVFDMIRQFEQSTQLTINYKITARRPGDIASYYADNTKAKELLNWQTKYSIEQACVDLWRFENLQNND